MPLTSRFRRQHDEALALATKIMSATQRLLETEDAAAAAAIEADFSQLDSTLRLHFAQEDKELYPRLMASADRTTAATAKAFFDEMGGLGPRFHAFSRRWIVPGAIAAQPHAFAEESAAIFATLAARIAHENEELYPLADWADGQESESDAA